MYLRCKKNKTNLPKVHAWIAWVGSWRAGLTSWGQIRGLQLEQAILAPDLWAKRKWTTAVSNEVAWQLNSSLDSCLLQQDPLRCSEGKRGKEATIMVVITAFRIALSFCPFMSFKSTLIPFLQSGETRDLLRSAPLLPDTTSAYYWHKRAPQFFGGADVSRLNTWRKSVASREWGHVKTFPACHDIFRAALAGKLSQRSTVWESCRQWAALRCLLESGKTQYQCALRV